MIETKSKIYTDAPIICVSKRHWVVYVLPSFLIFVGLLFALSFAKYYSVFGLLLIVLSVHRILENKSSQWILTERELIIKSGVLPWRKTFYDVPFDNIFEAFYTHGFWSNIFGYGNLNIRRTEGLTTELQMRKMTCHKEMTGKINAMVRALKNTQPQTIIQQSQPANSLADELEKLSRLKQQGALSDEEFERMKQRLMN